MVLAPMLFRAELGTLADPIKRVSLPLTAWDELAFPDAGTSTTAAVPKPRLVRAVETLFRSDKLLAIANFRLSAFCRSVWLASDPVIAPQLTVPEPPPPAAVSQVEPLSKYIFAESVAK